MSFVSAPSLGRERSFHVDSPIGDGYWYDESD
jgi:hypothetical protein